MATNYNSDQAAYVSRQEMENSEFAVSVKPTNTLIHMVECAPNETQLPIKNIRSIAVPVGQDLRVYDQGLFQFATQANPNQDLGELWVSYCVEFFKPVLALENSVVPTQSFHAVRNDVSTGAPLGNVTLLSNGNLATSIGTTTMTITNLQVGVTYNLQFVVTSTGTATVVVAPITSFGTGATQLTWMAANGSSDVNTAVATNGTASDASSYTTFFVATASSTVLTCGGSGVYGSVPNSVEIIINAVSPTVTA